MDHFCYLCFVFVMLFLSVHCSFAVTFEIGLASWLSCKLCYIVFCHFPLWCPGSGVVIDWIDS